MDPWLRAELDSKGDALAVLCMKYDVTSLELFGSGARGDWIAGESDLDFLVVFRPIANSSIADRYLGLAEGLEVLFDRPVDLLTSRSIRNPYFQEMIDATRIAVYAG